MEQRDEDDEPEDQKDDTLKLDPQQLVIENAMPNDFASFRQEEPLQATERPHLSKKVILDYEYYDMV